MAKSGAAMLPFSPKDAREIAHFIQGKNALWINSYLKKVLEKKAAIPFKRYNQNRGHKEGIGPGAYADKSVEGTLQILENAFANAKQKGLSENDLIIVHAVAYRAVAKEKRRGKYSTIEIILEEKKKDKKTAKKKIGENKAESK